MRAYLAITAVLFALVTVLHIWRAVAESMRLAADPWFLLSTACSALLCLWAIRLLAGGQGSRTPPGAVSR